LQFQSTRPRGARPSQNSKSFKLLAFQSTRPRGARLTWMPLDSPTAAVSIHAPAGGATRYRNQSCFSPCLLQSTRPRGARLRPRSIANSKQSFNPRARGGRDFKLLYAETLVLVFQSTRPRGARHRITLFL